MRLTVTNANGSLNDAEAGAVILPSGDARTRSGSRGL
jgi:hypothetical protein